jgi:uncharacterized protein YjdB
MHTPMGTASPTSPGTWATPVFDFESAPVSLEVNKTFTRTATGGVPPYGYTSDNASIASVNASGIATGHAAGSTYINGSDSDGNSGRYALTVTAIAPPFAFPGTPVTLEVGETYTRRASGGTPPYTYTSTSTTVATVNTDGLVSALRIGRTTISARDQADGRGSYDVEVIDSVPPFYLDPSAKAMTVGEKYTRTPTGGHPPYTYSSSNPVIATVNANGTVTAIAVGTTTITARDTRNASGSYVVTVAIAAPTLLAPTCSYVSGGTLDPSQVPAGGLPFTVNYATILVDDYIELTWSGATSGTVTKEVTTTGAQTLTLAKSYVEASKGRDVSVTYRVLRSGSWSGTSPALSFSVRIPAITDGLEDLPYGRVTGLSRSNYSATLLGNGSAQIRATTPGQSAPYFVGRHLQVHNNSGAGSAGISFNFSRLPCLSVRLGVGLIHTRPAVTLRATNGTTKTITFPNNNQWLDASFGDGREIASMDISASSGIIDFSIDNVTLTY